MAWGIAAAFISVYQGVAASNASKKGGRAARRAAFANAADIRELAGINADAYLRAGEINAGAVEVVGEANALAVERATARNAFLYALQATEDRRRLILSQQKTAGAIRARVGATGVQTNTGSPQHYLISEVKLGIKERRYGDLKAYWTLRNIQEEGADKASVIRLTSEQNAMVTRMNAEIQAEVSLADAERRADATGRGGNLAQSTANSAAQGQLIQGFANAAGSLYQGYSSGAFGNPNSTNPYGNTSMTLYTNQAGTSGGGYMAAGNSSSSLVSFQSAY